MPQPEETHPAAPKTVLGLELAVQLYAGCDYGPDIVLQAAGVFDRRIAECVPPGPGLAARILASLETIITKQEETMTSIDNLQAADAALKAEVTQILADIVQALSADNPDIDAVTADVNAQIALLQGGDPLNAPPVTPPSSVTGVSN